MATTLTTYSRPNHEEAKRPVRLSSTSGRVFGGQNDASSREEHPNKRRRVSETSDEQENDLLSVQTKKPRSFEEEIGPHIRRVLSPLTASKFKTTELRLALFRSMIQSPWAEEFEHHIGKPDGTFQVRLARAVYDEAFRMQQLPQFQVSPRVPAISKPITPVPVPSPLPRLSQSTAGASKVKPPVVPDRRQTPIPVPTRPSSVLATLPKPKPKPKPNLPPWALSGRISTSAIPLPQYAAPVNTSRGLIKKTESISNTLLDPIVISSSDDDTKDESLAKLTGTARIPDPKPGLSVVPAVRHLPMNGVRKSSQNIRLRPKGVQLPQLPIARPTPIQISHSRTSASAELGRSRETSVATSVGRDRFESHPASARSSQAGYESAGTGLRVVQDHGLGGRPRRAQAAPIYDLKKLSDLQRQPSLLQDTDSKPRRRRTKQAWRHAVEAPPSSENFRSRAHAQAWRHDGDTTKSSKEKETPGFSWFSRTRRPYLASSARQKLLRAAQQSIDPGVLERPQVVHVDFGADERASLEELARRTHGLLTISSGASTNERRARLMRELPAAAKREGKLPMRTESDIAGFLDDVMANKTQMVSGAYSLGRDDYDQYGDHARSSQVHSLLFARELGGTVHWARSRGQHNYSNEFRKWHEDGLELRTEWTNCAGDIATIAWVSDDAFICGTTEHSDSHNQQYNKPGNLALGSCSLDTLRGYPDHRIVRPMVEKGENATEAMRHSQDPWLYSSVVSSSYDATRDLAFTSGFDRTVKIWKTQKDGSSMRLLGEWRHDGNVNFVVASTHRAGIVATAADIPTKAVRVYMLQEDNIAGSPYNELSCSRITDQDGNEVLNENWTYFPATMQWGLAPGVKNMLLVGYSPRSLSGDDNDIPEARRDYGELCLWDGLTGEKWKVTSVNRQNIFEVAWHPSQPCFAAATAPAGQDVASDVRTQIRIFHLSDSIYVNGQDIGKGYAAVKTLDCSAIDINELTIVSKCPRSCYVTAGCTDGNVYVWDTAAQDDKPIHVLSHGSPVEEFEGDREREDTGVKFTAWGSSLDRFYSGASDGVVKVWNVRSLGNPLVRDVLEVAAPVSCGMFAPNKNRLVIGDASGRVFLLSLDEAEQKPASFVKVPGVSRAIRQPKNLVPHAEPPPPPGAAQLAAQPETGIQLSKFYMESGILAYPPGLSRDATLGVVQGPAYAALGYYNRRAHINQDPMQPLLASDEAKQQWVVKNVAARQGVHTDARKVLRRIEPSQGVKNRHRTNQEMDLDIDALSIELLHELKLDGADLMTEPDYDFQYED